LQILRICKFLKQIYKNHIGYRIVIEASRYVVGTTFRESGIRVETVSLRRHTVTSIPSAEQARRRQQMKSVIHNELLRTALT
jgi:hypothetical protein